jgi:Na+/glutamate symporter
MSVLSRILSYVAACAAVCLVLWIAASVKPDLLLLLAWVVANAIALVVTWRVAGRDGRNRVGWVAATLLVGPIAWIAMVATRPSPPA